MKLITAIVNKEDSKNVCNELIKAKFYVTRLATTGGFLRAGNTTLLMGVNDDKLDGAIKIIEKVCKSRKQIAPSPSPIAGGTGAYVPYPIAVMVGGAVITQEFADQIGADFYAKDAAASTRVTV